MLTLCSNESYDELLKLDPETGAAELASRRTETLPSACHGHFVRSSSGFVCFYRWDGGLVFRVGGKAFDIPESANARIEENRESSTLKIFFNDSQICQWTYAKPKRDFIDNLRYTEEEDLDFGMFVRNVINDPERRLIIYPSKRHGESIA